MEKIGQKTVAGAGAAMKGTTDVAIFAKCECCGLTEECTEEYIKRVRERYSGRWICGLCAEAVKDEMVRSEKRIGNEEALNQHMSFCNKFRSPPKNPTEELICAVKQLVLRSLDSPRSRKPAGLVLVRSQSCRPALQSSCSLKMN
ncbi:hypothetical protein Salat_2402100 [Sesamum alatum]|uniref:DUF1677 family protein n=1 Tax=Sesamum alatum TaxID=300844 RepID=A0AAE1XYF7_9LAMI|nr:hypothetical protein Salat_2402100 [Sesamum alatum]